MSPSRVLVCDDELLIRLWLEEKLTDAGYAVVCAEDGGSALRLQQAEPADLVLLDLRLPDISGQQVLERLKAEEPDLPIIMMTAYGDVDTAVAAVRAGAHHFLEKPVERGELLLLIEQAFETKRLKGQVMLSRELNRWTFSEVTIVGHSPAIREIVEFIERLAGRGGPTTVLIRGESGTGKDVVARAIHARGPRRDGAFIDVNCTALPEQLLESELFGHEAGAFTDAKSSKRGLVELAEGGTIFLDEIGEMPISAQAKLLRFIEARRFRRVGGIRDLEVDVQVLVATNRNLEEAVERGGFREDLFYRLNVVPIVLPPLRQRREDIAPLTTLFIEQLASGMRRPGPEVSVGAMRLMESYDWPGNARQIRNILERIMLFYDVDRIQPEHLPPEIGGVSTEEVLDFVLPSEGVDLEEIQKSLIEQALARAGGNKTEAARLLGISRDTLRYRLEKYQIGQNQ